MITYKITRDCLHCGKPFETVRYEVSVGKGKYCSRACYFAKKIHLETAFLKHVQKTATCWLWTGNRLTSGYGRFTFATVRYRAHRLAYTLFRGDIPEERVVMQLAERFGVTERTITEIANRRSYANI